MARKKNSDDENIIDGIAELPENEQIVEERKRTIRREKVKPETVKDEPAAEIDDADSDFDLNEDGRSEISQTSLAALIFDEGRDEPFENQYCSVHVRRYPDSMKDNFLTPCSSILNLPPLRNVELTTERSDIEETVRSIHGGGHFFFQIHFDNRMAKSWKVSLSDPPEAIAQAKAAKAAAANLPISASVAAKPSDPIADFISTLQQQKELRNVLYGEEQRRMEKQIADLKTELEKRREPQNQSDLALLLNVLKENSNPTLVDFAREYLSPDNREPSLGFWDFAKHVLDHPQEIGGLLQSLLGGVAPAPQPERIEAMLKKEPPETTTPQKPSGFQRKVLTEEPIPARVKELKSENAVEPSNNNVE